MKYPNQTIITLVFALIGALIPYIAVLCSGNHNKITVYFGSDFGWIYCFNLIAIAAMLLIRWGWQAFWKRNEALDLPLILCFGVLFWIHLRMPLDPLSMIGWVTVPLAVLALFVVILLLYALTRWVTFWIIPGRKS